MQPESPPPHNKEIEFFVTKLPNELNVLSYKIAFLNDGVVFREHGMDFGARIQIAGARTPDGFFYGFTVHMN